MNMNLLKWFSHLRRQKGQTLLITSVLVTTSALRAVPVLTYTRPLARVGGKSAELAVSSYTAESGIERVIADLVFGANPVATSYITTGISTAGVVPLSISTPGYTPPIVSVNNQVTQVTVGEPEAFLTVDSTYIDPGLNDSTLRTLPPGTGYLVRLYNVRPGVFQVNWAYDIAGSTRIAIWRGIPVDPNTQLPIPAGRVTTMPTAPPLREVTSLPSATSVFTNPFSAEEDVYTILFDNSVDTNNATRITNSYGDDGSFSQTWIFAPAAKDYLITSVAGDVTVSALVRQIPGLVEPPNIDQSWSITNPSYIKNKIQVLSWVQFTQQQTPTPTP